MRIPYAPTTPPNPSFAPIYSRIAARRAPRPLTSLDLALLHSPPVADGWNAFLGAIRTGTSLPPALFELAVCRVAVLNGAVYEWEHHAPLAIKAGVSVKGMEVVRSLGAGEAVARLKAAAGTTQGKKGANEEEGAADDLGRKEWAVLAYTDQMTKGVKVEDGVFAGLKDMLSEKEVVEITAAVAAYNCVSRFLVALDVGEANGREIKGVEDLDGGGALIHHGMGREGNGREGSALG
ncbi:hypothetical protein MMC25_003485 [Agyrium rufum]|nr:hypothetical protein [Agyrium rufum]